MEPRESTPTSESFSFVEAERKILELWNKNQIFQKSLEKTKGGKNYIFYDGPPFATGLPHHGHIVASTLKDVVPRYFTMKGFYVDRRFGWDCHGLPIEQEIDKKFGSLATMTPRYVFWECQNCEEKFKLTNCYGNGRYCATSSNSKLTG